jgi:acyl-CoA thioester hydrolase
MEFSHSVRMQVPFHDLDPLQMVWHGNYLKYFDMARFSLFNTAGIDFITYHRKKNYLFPIIRTDIRYITPLSAFDQFVCTATVVEAKHKIVINFIIRCEKDGKLCTKGSSEQVALTLPDYDLQFEIPKDIRSALGFD